jgi:hypothetical protein
MKASPSPPAKSRTPRGRSARKPREGELNQATIEQFDKEEMGIAPKE